MSMSDHYIRRFLLASALALALPFGYALAQTSDAATPPGHSEMGAWHHHGAMMDALNLSADQRKQLRLLMDAQQDTLRPLARELREERIALADLGNADNYDAGKAAQIAEHIGQLQGKIALASTEGHRKMLALLTPEQRAKFKAGPPQHPMHEGMAH